jgi:hypothetical protein
MCFSWRTRLILATAALAAGGCNSTYRPMLFHQGVPEPEGCCPEGMDMPMSGGPILGEPPMMGQGMVQPGTIVNPGAIPPGAVTIPGPGMTVPPAPPVAAPPVGPPPRSVPQANPALLPGKPTT